MIKFVSLRCVGCQNGQVKKKKYVVKAKHHKFCIYLCIQSIVVLYLRLSQRQVTDVEGPMFSHSMVVLKYGYLCVSKYIYVHI